MSERQQRSTTIPGQQPQRQIAAPTAFPRAARRLNDSVAPSLRAPVTPAIPSNLAPRSASDQPAPPPELVPVPDTPHDELLRQIEQAGYSIPKKCINSGVDLEAFTFKSRAYVRIRSLIQVLSLKVTLKKLSETPTGESTQRLLRVFDTVNKLIDEVEPLEGPRRFGNLAFRTFHQRLIAEAGTLLPSTIGHPRPEITDVTNNQAPNSNDPYTELVPYFLGSFGSQQRLDFGTGHELSFLAFFGGLWAVELLDPEISGEDILLVFEKYFQTVRRLIVRYNLEPAGSHGVWGLDDHFHLPYILGSAQIVDITQPDTPTPRFSPKVVLRPHVVERERHTNLYFSAIAFINKVKVGPFHEHSPILFDVTSVATWHKIHRGMIKMYVAEVLGKFPVVQHFVFGAGFFPWTDRESGSELPSSEIDSEDSQQQKEKAAAIRLLNSQYLGGGTSSHSRSGRAPGGSQAGTKAPWA